MDDAAPRTHDSCFSDVFVLSDDEIYTHLREYQPLHDYFALLPLPDDWTVETMKMSHPFFLLGILTAGTKHDLSVNPCLHEQFFRVLAERVVVRAEKSLDLLQGMLVQLFRSVPAMPSELVSRTKRL